MEKFESPSHERTEAAPAAGADGVAFAPIENEDFDGIVGLAAAAWYAPDGCGDLGAKALADVELSEEERGRIAHLMAADEVASYLADMTWGCKALLNGQVVGVVLTQGTHADEAARRRWEQLGAEARQAAEAALARLRGREERGADTPGPVYLDEVRATEEMRVEAGLAGQPRAPLLVVSGAARGHGLGRRLLDRARDHFRRHGSERYWLVTDTDCDWPFYEHLGLERLAQRPGTVAGAPDTYFIYGGRC